MVNRPRVMTSLGLFGVALLTASSTVAQTASPQREMPSGQTRPSGPWRGTPPPQGPQPSGSGQAPDAGSKRTPGSTMPGVPGSTMPGTPGGATPPGAGGGGAGNSGTGAPSTGGAGTTPGANGPGAAGGTGAVPGLGDAAAGNGPAPTPGLGGALSSSESFFGMLGDQAPIARTFAIRVPTPPPIPDPGKPPQPPIVHPGTGKAVAILPSIRAFKISENQSPAPQNRIYFSSNYYDNLNQQVNERFKSGIDHLKAYRYVLGIEKTFLEGRASFGLRLPIDSLSTRSTIPGFGGTTHAAGDLAAIVKYALIQDRDAGRLLSVGLLTSMPTGPRSFAGAKGIRSPHNASLQPFIGFIQSYGDFYVQGFSAVDVPMNPNDVTLFYNDIGMGYYVYRSNNFKQLITAIAPTMELHVNTPLNHRNPYNLKDPAGTYDVVDLTFGTNFQIRKRGLLAIAIVEPISGPRPFTLETIVQFNIRF